VVSINDAIDGLAIGSERASPRISIRRLGQLAGGETCKCLYLFVGNTVARVIQSSVDYLYDPLVQSAATTLNLRVDRTECRSALRVRYISAT
jgi:hypothetical protein